MSCGYTLGLYYPRVYRNRRSITYLVASIPSISYDDQSNSMLSPKKKKTRVVNNLLQEDTQQRCDFDKTKKNIE